MIKIEKDEWSLSDYNEDQLEALKQGRNWSRPYWGNIDDIDPRTHNVAQMWIKCCGRGVVKMGEGMMKYGNIDHMKPEDYTAEQMQDESIRIGRETTPLNDETNAIFSLQAALSDYDSALNSFTASWHGLSAEDRAKDKEILNHLEAQIVESKKKLVCECKKLCYMFAYLEGKD